MRIILKYHLVLFLFSFSFYAIANETPAGDKLFQKLCSECHQKDGNSKDNNIPKIAGFSAILTFDILDQFKSDDRRSIPIKTNANEEKSAEEKGIEETDMNAITKKLKTNEIEAISLFLANQISKPTTQEYDQELATSGKQIHMDLCENCHVEEGTSNIEDAPILKGQWKRYLQRQFEALSEKKRYMPRRMKKRFRKLSVDDKKALIEFYISTANLKNLK